MTRDLLLLAVGVGLGGIAGGWFGWARGYQAGIRDVVSQLLAGAERRGMTLAEVREMLGAGRCLSRPDQKEDP